MLVRIRFGKGLRVGKTRRRNKRVALAVSALLTPAAFLAAVLALWRIAADLNFTGKFAIASGVFSHWQVWLVTAALLHLFSRMLARYGKRDEEKRSMTA
jgi:arginine exporter protein ArgO